MENQIHKLPQKQMALKLKLLILLFLSLLVGNVYATDYTQDANCVGGWLLDDSSGYPQDASVNNNDWDGNIGTYTYSQTGQFGTALDFDGNDYAAQARFPIDQATNISLVIYYYTTTSPQTRGAMINTSWGDSGGGVALEAGGYDETNNTKIVVLFHNISWHISSASITTSSWTHVATTIATNGSKCDLIVYNDGVSVLSESDITAPGVSNRYGSYLAIEAAGYFTGKLDEAGMFERVLSSTEVNDIMDNGLVGSAPPAARRMFLVN